MKKFTKIFMCLMLCVMSVCLVACGKNSDKEFNYPPSSGAVYGNGGLAVRKGNCLYYVNGFQNVDAMVEQNASYVLGSLMIAELDENGNVITDENGVMKSEYINTMSDKLCGFEATSLFIGGNYLYFTSPCQEDESSSSKDKVWAKERVEFYRIKLDKSSKPEEVYQSNVSYENLDFKYYYEGGYTYILVYEGGASLEEDGYTDALYRVNTSTQESVLIKDNVLSYVMTDDAQNIFYSFKNNNLYQLNQYNVCSNVSTEFATKDVDFDIVDVRGGKIFISYETDLIVTSTDIYMASISPKQAFGKTPVVTGVQTYDSYYISDDCGYFVGIKGNQIKVKNLNNNLDLDRVTDADAESITYIGMSNGCLIYVDDSNMIKSFSYYNYANNQDEEIKQLSKVEDINTEYFDMDDSYIYFYKTVNGREYLHRVSLSANYVEDETNDQMIGVYLDGDAPEITETEEE